MGDKKTKKSFIHRQLAANPEAIQEGVNDIKNVIEGKQLWGALNARRRGLKNNLKCFDDVLNYVIEAPNAITEREHQRYREVLADYIAEVNEAIHEAGVEQVLSDEVTTLRTLYETISPDERDGVPHPLSISESGYETRYEAEHGDTFRYIGAPGELPEGWGGEKLGSPVGREVGDRVQVIGEEEYQASETLFEQMLSHNFFVELLQEDDDTIIIQKLNDGGPVEGTVQFLSQHELDYFYERTD